MTDTEEQGQEEQEGQAEKREFQIEFTGSLTVEAADEEEAYEEAAAEIAWCRCSFDILECRDLSAPATAEDRA